MKRAAIIFSVLLLLMTACASTSTEEAASTETPFPTITPSPIASPTLTLTPTPAASPTPYTYVLAETPMPEPRETITAENVSDVVLFSRWGNGVVGEVLYAPDGSVIVVGSSIGVFFFDPETLVQVQFIETSSRVSAMAISPNGQILVAATTEEVLVLEMNSGEIIRTLEYEAVSLDFSPDGRLLAIGSHFRQEPDTINLILVSDWEVIQLFPSRVWALAFSGDGKYLAAGGVGSVYVWEMVEDKANLVHEDIYCGASPLEFAFSNGSRVLNVAAADAYRNSFHCMIRLLDGEGIGILDEVSDYSGEASLVISPSGKYTAFATDRIIIRDSTNQKHILTINPDLESIRSIAWSPDESSLVTTSEEGGLQIWDAASGKPRLSVDVFSQAIKVMDCDPQGDLVAYNYDRESEVILRQINDGIILDTLETNRYVYSFAFSPSEDILAVGLNSNLIQVWDLEGRQILKELGVNSYGDSIVYVSNDGSILAAKTSHEEFVDNISMWRISDWSLINSLDPSQEGKIKNFVMSLDGRFFAYSSTEEFGLTIFNVDTNAFEQEASISGSGLFSFSPNGYYLVSIKESQYGISSDESIVRVWRTDNWEMVQAFSAGVHQNEGWIFHDLYESWDWSAEGYLLAWAGSDGVVRLIDVEKGEVVHSLPGHTLWATSVCFTGNGSLIASSSIDGTIRLWGILP